MTSLRKMKPTTPIEGKRADVIICDDPFSFDGIDRAISVDVPPRHAKTQKLNASIGAWMSKSNGMATAQIATVNVRVRAPQEEMITPLSPIEGIRWGEDRLARANSKQAFRRRVINSLREIFSIPSDLAFTSDYDGIGVVVTCQPPHGGNGGRRRAMKFPLMDEMAIVLSVARSLGVLRESRGK